MPTLNLGRVRFNWIGPYDPLVAYLEYDCVEQDGQSYVCIAPVTGTGPLDSGGSTYWDPMLVRSADYNQARDDAIAAAIASEDSATAAAGSASSAAGSASSASGSATKADQWANEVEDVEIEAGKYSAKHYAQKAAAFGDPNQFDITADQTDDTRTSAEWMAALLVAQQKANDSSVAAELTVDVSGGTDVVVGAADSKHGLIKLTGALTANISVVVPDTPQLYTIINQSTGNYAITVKTAAGSGVSIPQSSVREVRSDGTNVVLNEAFAPITRSRKNLIINGDFRVWQRGNAFTQNGYTADRWGFVNFGGGTVARLDGNTDNYRRLVAILADGTASSDYVFYQRIEEVRTLSGKKATLSFEARLEDGTPGGSVDARVALEQHFGTGGSPSQALQVGEAVFTPGNTFQRYEFTFDIPEISNKTLGSNNDDRLQVAFVIDKAEVLPSGGGLLLRDVQLEEGDRATEFERKSVGETLQLCQRYFCLSPVFFTDSFTAGGQNSGSPVYWPVTMRATPSVVMTGSVSITNVSAENTYTPTPGGVKYEVTSGGAGGAFVDGRILLADAEL